MDEERHSTSIQHQCMLSDYKPSSGPLDSRYLQNPKEGDMVGL